MHSLEESLARLREVVRPTVFHALLTQEAVGRVKEDRIRIVRVIPFVSNSFIPEFAGRFDTVRGQVWLVGQFRMMLGIRVFMSVWLGLAAAMLLMTLVAAARGSLLVWWGPLAIAGMFMGGVGLVAIGRWFARNDAAWLSGRISSALDSPPAALGGTYRPIE
jgi:hypothetical protein